MITVANISDIEPSQYDEVWAIVRSPKNAPKWMRHVPELSPSWSLFELYRKKRASSLWTRTVFEEEYVPRFLDEMKTKAARDKLNELFLRSRNGEHIVIACFCSDVGKCHRSIVASLLDGVGCEVEMLDGTVNKSYYAMYKANRIKKK